VSLVAAKRASDFVDLTGTLADDHPEPWRILEVALFFIGKKHDNLRSIQVQIMLRLETAEILEFLEQILCDLPMFQANIRGNLGEGNDIG